MITLSSLHIWRLSKKETRRFTLVPWTLQTGERMGDWTKLGGLFHGMNHFIMIHTTYTAKPPTTPYNPIDPTVKRKFIADPTVKHVGFQCIVFDAFSTDVEKVILVNKSDHYNFNFSLVKVMFQISISAFRNRCCKHWFWKENLMFTIAISLYRDRCLKNQFIHTWTLKIRMVFILECGLFWGLSSSLRSFQSKTRHQKTCPPSTLSLHGKHPKY